MKLPVDQDRPEPAPNSSAVVLEAIVRRRCLSVTYNRKRMILAPHILYMRNGSPHLDAVTISLEMMAPKVVKVGTFKLDGLSELRLTEREFAVSDLFDAADPKYAGGALLVVE
ncbi:hypothetical protein [Sphingosinithalassobacter sp. LHW66-3]|uniref:hypothetical protein n=1 Tax=Sphingosinithalassobacter sp. LHW66-3 TaxID=3424718 RepID=UPI003D6A35A4